LEQTATLKIRSETSLILTLNGMNFYCEYVKSSNGHFMIAFYDGDPYFGIGGHRKKGNGYYFLFKDQVLTVIGRAERPNDGKVGNNGFFIINDWLFDDGTKSIAYAFNDKGEEIIKKHLNANLLTNAISPTGHFAIFKTANSNSNDNSVLLLYDLYAKQMIWKKHFGFQNPDHFSIIDNQFIKLNYKDKQTIVLDWDCRHVAYENNGN
jgi:hypothetical protein